MDQAAITPLPTHCANCAHIPELAPLSTAARSPEPLASLYLTPRFAVGFADGPILAGRICLRCGARWRLD